MDRDNELINQITPNVLQVLDSRRFFEALDDMICPADSARPRASCEETYSISTTILTRCGFEQKAIADITRVLAARGGCCDCEILYNVAEESRLKSEYWKAIAAGCKPGGSSLRHGGNGEHP